MMSDHTYAMLLIYITGLATGAFIVSVWGAK